MTAQTAHQTVMLTNANISDTALAFIMEFGSPDYISIEEGDRVLLSWDIGGGAGLDVDLDGLCFTSASIGQDELRWPVRALSGSTNAEMAVRFCRMAVDRWTAKYL